MIRLAMQAHAGRKIRAWRGVVDENDVPIPFDEATFVAIVMEFDIWPEITKALEEGEDFEQEQTEALAGNA